MLNSTGRSLWLICLVLLMSFQTTQSFRQFERRSDLANVPPVSASGWTVPLHGSRTCKPHGSCTDSLTPPPARKPLQYLTLGRGLYTYTCNGEGPDEVPRFQSQSTQLYNAAPLIPRLANEDALHALVAELALFDYMSLENSTLECIGAIGTVNNTAIITLVEIATFEAWAYESVLAPNDPSVDGRWAHSVSPHRSWDVYRVEMTGGAPPSCTGEARTLEVGYAAEYWFYHSAGEDLKTDPDNEDSEDHNAAFRHTMSMI